VDSSTSHISAVVLAYGDEPWVERCVEALHASVGVDVDVVVVDNGCTTGAPDRLEGRDGVTVVRPGMNLGFAGGCNAGAAVARGDLIALVNADALVEPHALARLANVAVRPEVGLATASIRLADDPDRLNSAGNPLHFSGLSWAGAFGELASRHSRQVDVLGASGAGMMLRRGLWAELGGFATEYFAYLEDTELSLRCWQRGLRVVYVPDAVVLHRYVFSRNALKHYLLERNRLLLLLTAFERRTLFALLPSLLVVEVCTIALALAQGWVGGKLRAYAWLLRHVDLVRCRRTKLQSERTVPDAQLFPLLAARLTMANVAPPPGLAVVDATLAAYWAMVRRLLVAMAR
jgi:GT2 family glycosyltransferase